MGVHFIQELNMVYFHRNCVNLCDALKESMLTKVIERFTNYNPFGPKQKLLLNPNFQAVIWYVNFFVFL